MVLPRDLVASETLDPYDRLPAKLNWHTVDLVTTTIDGLKSFCDDLEISRSDVMKVLWGSILQCYFGEDTPRFGVFTTKSDSTTWEASYCQVAINTKLDVVAHCRNPLLGNPQQDIGLVQEKAKTAICLHNLIPRVHTSDASIISQDKEFDEVNSVR